MTGRIGFTGERCVIDSQEVAEIHLEHLHRYAVARKFCAGRRVLDIACGSGYGSAILAECAGHVTGVDIAADVVESNKKFYSMPNLDFRSGRAEKLEFGDGSFDVVVSFETIEHLPESGQELFLSEIRRVLAPGGLLVISSPDKKYYTDAKHLFNEFHLHELYHDEFIARLKRDYRRVKFGRQKVFFASILKAEDDCGETDYFSTFHNHSSETCGIAEIEPGGYFYTLAIASDSELPALPSSLNVDGNGDILAVLNRQINQAFVAADEQYRSNKVLLDTITGNEVRYGEIRAWAEEQLQNNRQLLARNQELASAQEEWRQASAVALEKIQQENQSLREEIRRLECGQAGKCAESAALKAELSTAGVELSATKAELSAAGVELSATKAELSAAKAELSAAKAELSAAGVELSATKAELSAAGVELSATKAELSAAKAELSTAGVELSATKAELSATKAQLSAAGVENEKVFGWAEEQLTNNGILVRRNEELSRHLQELEASYRERTLRRKVKELLKQIPGVRRFRGPVGNICFGIQGEEAMPFSYRVKSELKKIPLVRKSWNRWKTFREKQQRQEEVAQQKQFMEHVDSYLESRVAESGKPGPLIDVIIPVYNGLQHLKKLFPALFANTPTPHRFIIIDDCSPDPEVRSYIEAAIRKRKDCVFLRNKRNLGFTGTVNRAAMKVRSKIFVLLNTDTVVPENWLRRLTRPFETEEKLASATPFTNSAVFFSFPVMGEDNPLPSGFTCQEVDAAFGRLNIPVTSDCEFINGVGFCMAINRVCWNEIGALDEAAFGKGFGEESDWCMRAMSRGWKNIVVPDLFVYHDHGGSFDSKEKQQLVKDHLEILRKRWGNYLDKIGPFVAADPWAKYRFAALVALFCSREVVLVVDYAGEKGGAYLYRKQRTDAMFRAGETVILLSYPCRLDNKWYLSFYCQETPVRFEFSAFEDIRRILSRFKIKRAFINNFAFSNHTLTLLSFFSGRTEETYGKVESGLCSMVLQGCQLRQEFTASSDGLELIEFKVATYARKNTGTIRIRIGDMFSGETFYDKNFDVSLFRDNFWIQCIFEPRRDSRNRNYVLTIDGIDGTVDNAISFYHCPGHDDVQSHYTYNGDQISGCLIFRLEFANGEQPYYPIEYAYHDFYSLCPSFFLLLNDYSYCGVENDLERCRKCLPKNERRIFECEDIQVWRHYWSRFLSGCSIYRFFSENTYRMASRVYQFAPEKVMITPHAEECHFTSEYTLPALSNPLRIGVVGAWSAEKGVRNVKELSRFLRSVRPDAEIHFYGHCYVTPEEEQAMKDHYSNFIFHGAYEVKSLPELFVRDRIAMVFFSSPCPETFSFVVYELMMLHVPIVAFPIGAPGDRIAGYDRGFITRDFSAPAVYEGILALEKRLYPPSTADGKRRLLLYVHFDADNTFSMIDECLACALKAYSSRMILISNSPLPPEATAIAGNVFDEVILRPNTGFDFKAWAEVFLSLSREELASYDEIIFANNSLIGPCFPLREMFDAMAGRREDFWGAVLHPHFRVNGREFPEHLQSFFLVFREKLLRSDVFREFWQTVKAEKSLMDVVEKYEMELTRYFKRAGFSYSAYYTMKDAFDSLYIKPESYLARHFPFVKKKAFTMAENVPAAWKRLADSDYPPQILDVLRK